MATGDPNNPTATTPVISADSTQQINSAATAIGNLNSTVERLGHFLEGTLEKFAGFKTASGDAKTGLDSLGNAADIVAVSIIGVSTAFDGFSDYTASVGKFSDQLKAMGGVASFSAERMKEVASAMGMKGVAVAAVDDIQKFITKTAAAADSALSLQQGYLGMQAATGGLGKVYAEAGTDLNGLNEIMLKQQTLTKEVARSTGTSLTQTMKYYQDLGSVIPDALEKTTSVTNQSGTSMNFLAAAMTQAAGTGMKESDVIKSMTAAYEDFGLEGDKALEFTQRMSDLSNTLGVNLQYTQKFITDTADTFKTLSDSGTNAADVFNEMFQSFRDTGLSAAQSSGMIGEITKSVSGLTVAQKAFLSAQTGGPGGLRGAFQIENMIRKGDITGVINKEMENLKKQFGGKIYTQEEAGQSDFAANQFMKQRELLKSGAMGSLVKDDAGATRLLEAMKNGMNASGLKSVAETLKDSTAKGQDVQERSAGLLQRIANDLEGEATLGGAKALDAIQKFQGSTVRTDRSAAGAVRANDMYLDRRTNAAQNAAGIATMTGRHDQSDRADIGIQRGEMAKDLSLAMSAVMPSSFQPLIDKMMGGAASTTKGGAAEGQKAYSDEMAKLAKQQKDLQQDIAAHKGVGVDAQKAKLNEVTGEQVQLQSFNTKMNDIMKKDVFGTTATSMDMRNKGAVQTTVDAAKKDQAKPGAPGHEHAGIQAAPGKQQLEFTIKGINVVCDKCGNTMKPDAHTTVTTAGQTT